MSQNSIGKRRELHVGVQIFFDILFIVGTPLGFPAIRLLFKGWRLRPRKWFWILLGLAGLVATGFYFVFLEEFLIPFLLFMLFTNVYSICIDRQYVLKYNVMVRSGYFEDRARMKQANRQRQDRTWEYQAQESMDKAMGTEKRVKAAQEVSSKKAKKAKQPKQQTTVEPSTVKPQINPIKVEPVRPVAPAQPAAPKEDTNQGKRKLDL